MSEPNSLILAARQVLTQGQTLLAALDAKSYQYKPSAERSSIAYDLGRRRRQDFW